GRPLSSTSPGLPSGLATRRPLVGAGPGGVSGPAILPMGVHAVWRARQRVDVPIIGAGGIRSGADALQYFLAGANLVEVGTALFSDPRTPGRVLSQLGRYGRRAGVADIRELIGAGGVP